MKALSSRMWNKLPMFIAIIAVIGTMLLEPPVASAVPADPPKEDYNPKNMANPLIETMDMGAVLIANLYNGRETEFMSLPQSQQTFYTAVVNRLATFQPSAEPIIVDLLGKNGGSLPALMGYNGSGIALNKQKLPNNCIFYDMR